ncbi:MAG: phosphoribosylformylglycinamidine synthase subunit PurL [Bacillota bacterium]
MPDQNEIRRKLGLSDSEYELIKEHLQREPNITELNMYSVMWSEHCSYKHSRSSLQLFPTAGPRVVQGPGENAGVIDIGDGYAAVFKIESHNHPSAIEPYQGAATGVGGILRDIFTMGARPVAFLNSLRFGELKSASCRYLFDGVVAGIGGYGNCVGVPTVAGEIYFEPCYEKNPLVNAMCVGVMPLERLVLGKAGGEGNLVVLAGAKTGRDGIGGVTFASEELSSDSEEDRPAVQVGDPFLGKLLIEATLEAVENGLVTGVQDLGGAGLTCALTETASRAGSGIEIELDRVPLREAGMPAAEILISESQERMLFIVEPEKLDRLKEVFRRWELELAVLGQVTKGGEVVARHGGEIVATVPAESIAGGAPCYYPQSREPAYYKELSTFDPLALPPLEDYRRALLDLLCSYDLASKEWVWRRYDHMVRTSTVQGPGGDAAVIRVRETGRALAMSVDGNGRYCYLDPYRGGMLAVCEATRNLSCCGAEPVGITDCLNFGNPEKPEMFWQFQEAVKGMAAACQAMDVPVVGGNVSFYNEVEGEAIYPTPVVGAVGLLESPEQQGGIAFKDEGDLILLLGSSDVSLGGSQLLKSCYGKVAGSPAAVDLDLEKRVQDLTRRLVRERLVESAHDLSEGGLAVALAESCLQGNMGAVIELHHSNHGAALALFGEGPSRLLVSVKPEQQEKTAALAEKAGVTLVKLGTAGGEVLEIDSGSGLLVSLHLYDMKQAFEEVFEWIME